MITATKIKKIAFNTEYHGSSHVLWKSSDYRGYVIISALNWSPLCKFCQCLHSFRHGVAMHMFT